jgi:hypothetical protein
MRDAKHGQRRRALFTLAIRLTPSAGAAQSFLRSVADHKLAREALGRVAELVVREKGLQGRGGLIGSQAA